MSIDTRLRGGLHAEAELMPEVETVDSWGAVLERSRRARAARGRLVLGVVAAAAAIALVVLLVVRPGADRGPQPAPRPSPTSTSSTPSETPSPMPFEGTWVAEGTGQDVVEQLQREGLEGFAATVLRPGNADSALRYVLKLSGGVVTMLVGFDGEPPDVHDMQSYSVLGGRLAFDPQPSECQAQFAWDVTGDRLTMRLVADDCPDAFGAPDEAFMNALYATFPFTRSS